MNYFTWDASTGGTCQIRVKGSLGTLTLTWRVCARATLRVVSRWAALLHMSPPVRTHARVLLQIFTRPTVGRMRAYTSLSTTASRVGGDNGDGGGFRKSGVRRGIRCARSWVRLRAFGPNLSVGLRFHNIL